MFVWRNGKERKRFKFWCLVEKIRCNSHSIGMALHPFWWNCQGMTISTHFYLFFHHYPFLLWKHFCLWYSSSTPTIPSDNDHHRSPPILRRSPPSSSPLPAKTTVWHLRAWYCSHDSPSCQMALRSAASPWAQTQICLAPRSALSQLAEIFQPPHRVSTPAAVNFVRRNPATTCPSEMVEKRADGYGSSLQDLWETFLQFIFFWNSSFFF